MITIQSKVQGPILQIQRGKSGFRARGDGVRKCHSSEIQTRLGRGRRFDNPKGIESSSPGLRGTSYPGLPPPTRFNPIGVVSQFGRGAATPLGLTAVAPFSQGSSFLATLGFGAESIWDLTLDFPKGMRAGSVAPPFYPSTRQHHWKHWALTADKHKWEKTGWFLPGPEARSPKSDCLGTRRFSLSAHIICVHPCPSVVSTAWIRLSDPRSSCRNFDGPMQRRFLRVMPPGDPGSGVGGQIPFESHYLSDLVHELDLGIGDNEFHADRGGSGRSGHFRPRDWTFWPSFHRFSP